MLPQDNILNSVLKLASLGMRIFPVHGIVNEKCTCNGRVTNCKPGKHPRITKFPQLATTKTKRLRDWFLTKFPNSNIGVVTGKPSGVWVLDVDRKTGGYESLEQLEKQYGPLPMTYRIRTGDGGEHYYFKHLYDYKISCSVGLIAHGLDVRGDGGYAIGPGSNHISGNYYSWIHGPEGIEIVPAPDWLLELIKASQKKSKKTSSTQAGFDATFQQILNGIRNNTLFKMFACHLRDKEISKSRVEFICQALNEYSCKEPLEEKEVLEAVKSAFNLPSRKSRLRKISKASERVLEFLIEQSKTEGWVVCKIKEIASTLGLSPKGTSVRIKQLQTFGLLHIQQFYGKPSKYTPVPSGSIKPASGKNLSDEHDFYDTFLKIAEGNRDITLFHKLSCHLRDKTISKPKVQIICLALNAYRFSHPPEDSKVLEVVDLAFSVPIRPTPLKSISDAAQRVLELLKARSSKTGFIECSIPEIASELGLSTEGTRKCLRQLEMFGLLHIQTKKGKKSIYTTSS